MRSCVISSQSLAPSVCPTNPDSSFIELIMAISVKPAATAQMLDAMPQPLFTLRSCGRTSRGRLKGDRAGTGELQAAEDLQRSRAIDVAPLPQWRKLLRLDAHGEVRQPHARQMTKHALQADFTAGPGV